MNSRLLFHFLFDHGLFVYCVAAWGFFMSRTAQDKGKNQCSDGPLVIRMCLCVSVIHPLDWCDEMMREYAELHRCTRQALEL